MKYCETTLDNIGYNRVISADFFSQEIQLSLYKTEEQIIRKLESIFGMSFYETYLQVI